MLITQVLNPPHKKIQATPLSIVIGHITIIYKLTELTVI